MFTPFYIKYLGIDAFGIISFYSVLLLITTIADVGLSSTFTRESARAHNNDDLLKLLCSIELPLCLLTLAVSAIPFFLSDFIARTWLNQTSAISHDTIAHSIKIMAVMVPAQVLITLYNSGLMGLQQQVVANTLQTIYVTIRSGFVIIAIYFAPQLEVFFVWQLGCMIFYVLVLRTTLVRKIGFSNLSTVRPSFQILRSIAGFSLGAFAIALISNFNNQLDKIFVSAHFPLADFGYYGAAAAVTQIANAAVAPIAIAIFPILVELATQNEQARKSYIFENFSRAVAFVASLATFFLFVFARDVMTIWLGSDIPTYVYAVVQWQAFGWLFFALQLMPSYLSLAHGETRPIIVAAIGLLIVAVPSLFLLSAAFGIVGAAIPWFVANAVSFFILSFIVIRRHYAGSFHQWLLRFTLLPAVLAAGMALAARTIAEVGDLGPLASCVAAASVGAISLLFFGYRSIDILNISRNVASGSGHFKQVPVTNIEPDV